MSIQSVSVESLDAEIRVRCGGVEGVVVEARHHIRSVWLSSVVSQSPEGRAQILTRPSPPAEASCGIVLVDECDDDDG